MLPSSSCPSSAAALYATPWEDTLAPPGPEASEPVHEASAFIVEPSVSYTGRWPDGRPQTIGDFLMTDAGQVAHQQLRQCWEKMLQWVRASPAEVRQLRKLLWLVMDRLPHSLGFDAYRQANLIGHGKRSLETLLRTASELSSHRQRIVAGDLLAVLKAHGTDPARGIRHCLARLQLSGPDATHRHEPLTPVQRVNRQLFRALTELLQAQGWDGPEMERRADANVAPLRYALGLDVDPSSLLSPAAPPFAPHDIAWVAMRMDQLDQAS